MTMRKGIIPLVLLLSLLGAAGCIGQSEPAENQTTAAITPEYAATLDEARERFGEELPEPEDLPEGYAFESALRYPGPDGYITAIYTGSAGDLSITRLASGNSTCPGMLTGTEGVVQGHGIEATLTFAGDDRSDDALKQLRWNRNEAAFCMTGNLPGFEMLEIAASVGGW
jgi:hypothetical protein